MVAEGASCFTFETTYRRELPFVKSLLRRAGIPPDDLDDVAQEVFLVLYGRWNEIEKNENVRAWACSIATRVCWNYGRSRRRRSKHIAGEYENLDNIADLKHSAPDENAERHRELAQVGNAVAQLSEERWKALLLTKIERRPAAEVAKMLGTSRETVHGRVRAARRDLRRSLGRAASAECGLERRLYRASAKA